MESRVLEFLKLDRHQILNEISRKNIFTDIENI